MRRGRNIFGYVPKRLKENEQLRIFLNKSFFLRETGNFKRLTIYKSLCLKNPFAVFLKSF